MTLEKRPLGDTGIDVSVLGLGTVKFGRNTDVKYPYPFDLPDDKQAANLIALSKDNGINLIDTAAAYGTSEERLGKLLQGQRQDWVIVSKAGEEYVNQQSSFDFSKQHVLHSIKRSLQRLKTDYLDVLLIHSNGLDEEIIYQHDIFHTLNVAKQEGLIRAGGISTKTVVGGLLTLKHSDVAMIWYNHTYTDEVAVLDAAKEMNKGILVKKGFGSGHLAPRDAIDFILQHTAVSSIIMGTINPEHLIENISAASCTPQEQEA